MTAALQDHIHKFCHVYMDDVIIWLDTLEDHQQHVDMVMKALQNTHLYLNPKKIPFCPDKSGFFGSPYLCTWNRTTISKI